MTYRRTAQEPNPYQGHADSTHAVWQDPSSYDHLKMGPPYLPDTSSPNAVGRPKLASNIRKSLYKEAADVSSTYVEDWTSFFDKMHQGYGEHPLKDLAVVVNFLRALEVIHQSCHWKAKGRPAYSDHLIFQKGYETATAGIDQIGERVIGLPGENGALVNPVIQAMHVAWIVRYICAGASQRETSDDYVHESYRAELWFLAMLKEVYHSLEADGKLTLGLDNLLQGVADEHEGLVYFFKQRSSE